MGAVYTGRRLTRRHCGNDPAGDRTAAALRRPPPPPEEGLVLKEGAKSAKVTGTSYDGATFDLGAPGRRTVLWFYPKANTGG